MQRIRIVLLPDEGSDRLAHATLRINGGMVYLSDEFPEWKFVMAKPPATLGGTSTGFTLVVDDPDAWFERHEGRRRSIRPLMDQFCGRSGTVRCPFGHLWSFYRPAHDED